MVLVMFFFKEYFFEPKIAFLYPITTKLLDIEKYPVICMLAGDLDLYGEKIHNYVHIATLFEHRVIDAIYINSIGRSFGSYVDIFISSELNQKIKKLKYKPSISKDGKIRFTFNNKKDFINFKLLF